MAKWLDDKEKRSMLYTKSKKYKHAIDKVIFNPPATIIIWRNGKKTVVKCGDDEAFDPEKGLAMAITKYEMGNKGNYYNQIRDILEEQSEYHMTEWLSEHDKAFENAIVREHFGEEPPKASDEDIIFWMKDKHFKGKSKEEVSKAVADFYEVHGFFTNSGFRCMLEEWDRRFEHRFGKKEEE